MTNHPQDPSGKGKSKGNKPIANDLDKTVLDIDLKALEKELESKTSEKLENQKKGAETESKEMRAALDETLIFERPPLDEEDTDLHRLKKQKEIEEKEKQEAEKAKAKEKPIESVSKASGNVSAETSHPKTSDAKEKAKHLWKEFTSFTTLEAPPQSRSAKIIEFVAGLFLLLLLLDVCIEGLAAASPLVSVSVGVSSLCVLVNVYFIIRKGNFHAGLEWSAWSFLALLIYATWQYGSFDAGTFSLLKQSPAQIFNFVFLLVLALVLFLIFQNPRASFLSKIVLSVFVLYGAAGFIENLIAGILYKKIWNVEDTLYGTALWSWLPFFYLRPLVFCFWFLLPFLTLYFLFQKTKAVFKKQKVYGRESTLALGLVFLALILGNLLLFKNHFPSALGFVLPAEKGWGETRAWSYGSGLSEDYDVEVSSANAMNEKDNDSLPAYKMGALFSSMGDNKKNIQLSLRNQGGVLLPFLKSNDVWVFQEQVQQKPIKMKLRPDAFLQAKTLVVLIDKSSAMASWLPYVDKASRALFEMTNSRERMFFVPFSDKASVQFVKNTKEMQKVSASLFAQGNRNVSSALDKALELLKNASGEKAVFLVTSGETLTEDLNAKYAPAFKNHQAKFYGVNLGEGLVDNLRLLAETSRGKWLSVKNPQNLPFALRSLFSDVFGQYQISYEGQSFGPKFSILTPQNGDDIYQDSPLQVKIQNYQDVRLNGARLYVDGKLLQESAVQSEDLVFGLSPAQLPKGSHVFKVALLGEGGKEFSQEVKLNISGEADFSFIRPLEGDVVSGQENIEVYYKNRKQNPIQKVEFLIDGQKMGEANAEPYLYTWDTQGLSGGHIIQAIATFADASTQSLQIKVNVVTDFGIRITSPSVGEFLNNLTEVEADVNHNLSEMIQKVEFWADGALLGEVSQAPYKYLWDNSDLATGRHLLQARVFASNNWVSTDAVLVNIGNGSLSVQLGDSPGAYLAPDYIEWLVDASSSMNAEVGGVTKLDLVKQSIIDMLPKMPAQTQIALRSYGASAGANHRDCRDSSILYPVKNLDPQKLSGVLNQIEAQGMSPLSYALEKIKTDLKSAYGTRVVILLTDGFDNCGGDPVGQLERWKKEKLNIKLYILGLDIEGTRAETELKRLVSIVGGQYYPVKTQKEIMEAFEEMVKVTYRVFDYKNREVIQKPIGSAGVLLRTGEYRVDVDLEPPLSKEKVLIQNGVERKLLIRKDGTSYTFSE